MSRKSQCFLQYRLKHKSTNIQYGNQKANLKRKVFKLLLKSSMELLLSLLLSGRLFHNLGAAALNIRSPKLDVLDFGTLRRPLLHDLSLRAGVYGEY